MPPPVSGVGSAGPEASVVPDEDTGDLHVIALVGDEQVHQIPDYQGFFRSLHGNSVAPAHRLPASTLGVTHAFEALMRGGIPVDQMKIFEGMIATGDVVDVGNTDELKIFFEALDRLKDTDPVYRNLLFMIGNHDMLHNGVSRSGWDFFGLLGIVLRRGGVEAYKKDIQIPEVGGRDHVLDKATLIEFLYRYFFDKEPDPARIESADYHHYTVKGRKKAAWNDTARVFRDFWKQEKDGSWNALVKYLPGSPDKPEKQWFHASAVKMGDFGTSDGKVPLYFLSMDTMDYLDDGMSLGALQGHVSSSQVRVLEAFIEEIRSAEPGAKFVLGGHFPAASGEFDKAGVAAIAKLRESGLHRILSDEDVVAYVAAHTHDRGYTDLSQHDLVQRSTPLPQVTVPAVMDYPNEMVLMTYGVEASDPDNVVLQFDFAGVDPKTLPGNSEAVCAEMKAIRPELLMYDDGIVHIKDDHMREFALPGTPFGKKLDLVLNLDEGAITRFDNIHDEVIKEDVIPAMVEDTQYYLRAFMGVMKLTLIEAGWNDEAAAIEAAYLKNVDHLNENYERIWKGEYRETAVGHSHVHLLDEHMGELDEAIRVFQEKAEGSNDENVAFVGHLLPLVRGFLGEYRYWLEGYERKLKTERDPQDFVYDASLGGSFYFKSVMAHMRDVPYGSQAWAFLVHSFLEAGEQRVEFYRGERVLSKTVPDRIRLEIASDGSRSVTLSPLAPGGEKIDRRGWCETDVPHYAEEGRKRARASVVPLGDRGVEGHFSYRLGYEGGLSGELGGQWHLLNRWDLPRLNGRLYLGGSTNFDGYWDVYGKGSLSVGDPWGLIDAGPTVMGGVVLSDPDRDPAQYDRFVGAGVGVNLFEGLVAFEANHLWREDAENEWRYGVKIDLATGLRALHWGGVAKWVGRDF